MTNGTRLNTLLATLVLILFPALKVSGATDEALLANALRDLDRKLENRSDYIAMRQMRIDSLTEKYRRDSTDSRTLLQIADLYTSFNNDSALHYLDRGRQRFAGTPDELPIRWRLASLLPLAGFVESAMREYRSINPADVPDDKRVQYLDAGRQMHSYIAAFYSNYPAISSAHADSALSIQRRMLDILPEESAEYKFNLGEYYFLDGQPHKSRPLLELTVSSEPPQSNRRARAAHHLSALAKTAGNRIQYLYYLAISATADVMSATREAISLQELGSGINDTDIRRAHNYLMTAMENAVECGAAVRMIDTSQALPIIEHSHNDSIRRWRKTAYIVIAAMAVLLIILVATLLLLRREMHRMSELQNHLRSANKTKEVYITQFLNLCSIYMDKLNQFCKIATRKLAAGQADDLYKMTKSGKFVEEQSKEFYELFDNAFLHIYPSFVDDVNRLLRPEERMVLREGELLNTDLRILAFMRLGIEDSAKIAQVLNYSINTIYSYRNRLKARAIEKNNFEQDLMKISSVSQ